MQRWCLGVIPWDGPAVAKRLRSQIGCEHVLWRFSATLSAEMTELVLILGINLAGLLFAIVVARWTSLRERSTVEVRRLGSAVERASRSFLAGCFRQVAFAAGLVAALFSALHLYVSG